MAVSGVIWVPAEYNIGSDATHYADELEIFVQSLPATYGQDHVPFYCAQPTDALVEGIALPALPHAKVVRFEAWPKKLKDIAEHLGSQGRER
jgi:hypothetical protein